MFTLSSDPQFTAEVKLTVPTAVGPVEQSFTARFAARSLDGLPVWRSLTTEAARQFLGETLRGWEGVVGDDGEPLPCDEKARAHLLGTPWAIWPMIGAYIAGIAPAARGN